MNKLIDRYMNMTFPIRYLQRFIFVFWCGLFFSISAHAAIYKAQIYPVINQKGILEFHFASDIGLKAPIGNFSIYGVSNGEWHYSEPIWEISKKIGSFSDVSEIQYGVALDGFSSIPAGRIEVGSHYLVEISGAGIAESIEFELIHCSGKVLVNVLGRGLKKPRPQIIVNTITRHDVRS